MSRHNGFEQKHFKNFNTNPEKLNNEQTNWEEDFDFAMNTGYGTPIGSLFNKNMDVDSTRQINNLVYIEGNEIIDNRNKVFDLTKEESRDVTSDNQSYNKNFNEEIKNCFRVEKKSSIPKVLSPTKIICDEYFRQRDQHVNFPEDNLVIEEETSSSIENTKILSENMDCMSLKIFNKKISEILLELLRTNTLSTDKLNEMNEFDKKILILFLAKKNGKYLRRFSNDKELFSNNQKLAKFIILSIDNCKQKKTKLFCLSETILNRILRKLFENWLTNFKNKLNLNNNDLNSFETNIKFWNDMFSKPQINKNKNSFKYTPKTFIKLIEDNIQMKKKENCRIYSSSRRSKPKYLNVFCKVKIKKIILDIFTNNTHFSEAAKEFLHDIKIQYKSLNNNPTTFKTNIKSNLSNFVSFARKWIKLETNKEKLNVNSFLSKFKCKKKKTKTKSKSKSRSLNSNLGNSESENENENLNNKFSLPSFLFEYKIVFDQILNE